VFGAAAWRLELEGGPDQHNLVISHPSEPEITVDNIEIAQFLDLIFSTSKCGTSRCASDRHLAKVDSVDIDVVDFDLEGDRRRFLQILSDDGGLKSRRAEHQQWQNVSFHNL
jgi:hypothetical protein